MKHPAILLLLGLLLAGGCRGTTPPSATELAERIRPDMSKVALDAWAGAEGHVSVWSGGTGYVEYALPSGETLSVACYSRDGLKTIFVHPDLFIYVQDQPGQQMKQISPLEPVESIDSNPATAATE